MKERLDKVLGRKASAPAPEAPRATETTLSTKPVFKKEEPVVEEPTPSAEVEKVDADEDDDVLDYFSKLAAEE